MPQGNRKGPGGEGPRTGRGMGFCSGNDQPGFEQDASSLKGGRRGAGRGKGRGACGAGAGIGRQQGNGDRKRRNPEREEEV